MIDSATIARIMDTARIEEVVSDYVSLKKRGVNLIGLCPFHDEKTGSFTVSPAKGIFKCFGCGKGGNAVHFIMEIEQVSFTEALKIVAKKYNIEIRERELSSEELAQQNDRESMYIVNSYAQKYFTQQLKEHPDGKVIGLGYFHERGFRDDIIEKFQLGYSLDQRDAFAQAALKAGYKKEYLVKTGLCMQQDNGQLTDRFRGRVIFPVHTLSGKVVAFGGRVLKKTEKTAKYVNSPESEIYHKSNELYGIYFAKHAIVKKDCCYLVEGYTDVISMHQAGIENVVASSGTSLTTGQIKLIHRFTNNVTILYDGDAAGIKASIRGIDLLLEEGLNIKVLLLPDGEDPDSFSRKQNASEFISYVEAHQTDFIRFKTNLLLDEAGNDPIKRAGLIQDVVRSIAIIPNNIVRQVYIKDCSTLLDINEEVLVNAINKINRQKKEEQNKAQHQTLSTTENKTAQDSANSVNSETSLLSGSVVDTETRNLLKVMVRYGERTLFSLEDGSNQTVGEFILQELGIDHIVFENPLYNEFIEEYRQHQHDTDFIAEKFFKFHPNSALSQLAINLITEKCTPSRIHYRFQVSENAKIKEVEIPTDADRLYELVPRLILELKNSLLEEHIRQTVLKLKHACEQKEDMSKIKELMDYCDALNTIKRDLAKSLGDRVINKL